MAPGTFCPPLSPSSSFAGKVVRQSPVFLAVVATVDRMPHRFLSSVLVFRSQVQQKHPGAVQLVETLKNHNYLFRAAARYPTASCIPFSAPT
jgi:hypothetical protein